MKKYKKIIICLSCVLLLLISFVLPCFAYSYVPNNTTVGQNAYHKTFPIAFDRGSLTCYGVVQEDFSQIDDTILFDMPTFVNTQYNYDYQSIGQVAYDSSVYPYSAGTVAYDVIYNSTDNAGFIGTNVFGRSVKYSHRQKLELYCDSAIITNDDLGNMDYEFSPFQITVYDMESVSRCRVSFSVARPRFVPVEFDDEGVATKVDIDYEFIDVLYDIEPYSVSDNGGYSYAFLTRGMLLDNDINIGGFLSYFPDGSDIPFSTVYMDYVYIKDIRVQIDGTRHFSINNMEPNYDFSFAYNNTCVDDRGEDFLINNVVESGVAPNVVKIDFEDISLVNWLVTQINGILNIELIPNVFIGSILWFIIGLAIFFLLLKIFLGG